MPSSFVNNFFDYQASPVVPAFLSCIENFLRGSRRNFYHCTPENSETGRFATIVPAKKGARPEGLALFDRLATFYQ
jgi:hypothetical protein